MENPYGIAAMWAQSDIIIKAVAFSLLFMSIATWCVILVKGIKLYRLKQPLAGSKQFWHAQDVQSGIKLLETPSGQDTPFSALVHEGMHAKAHHEQHKEDLHGNLPIAEWLTASLRTSIDESKSELQSNLAILASIGATAPFIGLFGTVWGIYHALISIGVSGQASIDKVAGPVGEALIMTAFGLAVAIPAVLGYNALTRGNKRIASRLNHFAHELHAFLLMGSAPSANSKRPIFKSVGGK
ncbi:MotA/TolQ/ExbB proton channel family protein [Pseudoalteromonas piscicida]|uniref:Biopolymer transport protein ExbB n=1 Tax=Pseudoalteromonas piscicida TaxID=43662 RepID=A0A2A5JWJ6_PSEO7|nr:MotA/TolQ/ExbB proton channel family protein [Pseudoalteromonas piscicida]PCK33701.1 biopolymer transporter ExbB [Pseudoalteromonas piscicida]